MAQLYAKKTSDGEKKALECEDSGELRVLLCGRQSDGTITPILMDATGKISTTT